MTSILSRGDQMTVDDSIPVGVMLDEGASALVFVLPCLLKPDPRSVREPHEKSDAQCRVSPPRMTACA